MHILVQFATSRSKMMDRDKLIQEIRPLLPISNMPQKSEAELFQNSVLRPILKLQHEYLVFTFLNSPSVIKKGFLQKHVDQKVKIIEHSLKTDQKLKSEIIHAITSLMTLDEIKRYLDTKSEFSKRIVSMAIQRLKDALIT